MSGSPVTPEKRARILRHFDPRHTTGSGHVNQLARLVGVAPCTVRQILREAGLNKKKK